jgi:hypothetical protein
LIFSFNLRNSSSRTMALEFTQHSREIHTRKSFWAKKGPVHKAENLTAICEPIA